MIIHFILNCLINLFMLLLATYKNFGFDIPNFILSILLWLGIQFMIFSGCAVLITSPYKLITGIVLSHIFLIIFDIMYLFFMYGILF